ncbi:hypothetical protein FA13DRAFT_1711596 [Coprinellus micaceus]|uniref:Uncharacterized protein n=1 Tax=Coprinellus micaceus TaxID=71717 RepID=A0A4Y7T409_COPMI|nr:hypothetical protein FA13DRAFT_1711596 [Coprinellus micaceus]
MRSELWKHLPKPLTARLPGPALAQLEIAGAFQLQYGLCPICQGHPSPYRPPLFAPWRRGPIVSWQDGIGASPYAAHEERVRISDRTTVVEPADGSGVEVHAFEVHAACGSERPGGECRDKFVWPACLVWVSPVTQFDRNEDSNVLSSAVKRRRPVPRGSESNVQTRSTTKLRTDIEAMQNRIQVLERSERQLKKRLADKMELIKEIKGERDEARTESVKAEEASAERDNALEGVTREANRYRGWWLTEYYHLKKVLELVPNEKGVEAITSEARERFLAYTAALETWR